ncbi:MAG: SDR family NAD(P)-dependent oxidoreductase [Defluviicoccus sp.]|nr:SDR family NAD(P)-dependent oxidoreductase [Defluviicoccus sp.]MDE0383214.1 SDR family NAD(P)-dependent oxidoreductase [Defluviicoccus sp.]
MAAPPRLDGRVALITGASRGIGAAIARRFSSEGALPVLAARSVGGLEEVDDAIRAASGGARSATLVEVDLAEASAADRLAAAIAERFGRLDILVANAAQLGTLAPMHQIDPREWDRVLAVNLGANFHLIRALDPALRAVEAGRAIFVGSGAGRLALPYWGSYAVSKAGLETMALAWAAETAKTRLRVNVVDPGGTRTGMRAQAFPGEDPASLKPPDALGDVFVALAAADCERHGEVIRCY